MEVRLIIQENSPQQISVILPVHNRFTLADETVASVAAQTYRPIELIIIDDCSDEPYQPQIHSDESLHIWTIRHESNLGPGASRETGRLAAHGDYIAYLDSDDLWHPQKLEKQINKLQENPEVGMCYCKSIVFSSLPLTGNEPISKRSDQYFSSFLPTILFGRPWNTSACMWRRDAVEKIGSWVNAWTWEDYAYDCRAGCRNIKIAYIPEILCYYRINQQFDQLSLVSIGLHKSTINKVPALIEMATDLSHSGKLVNGEIQKKFYSILKNNISALLTYNEIALSNLLLNEVLNFSRKYSFQWIKNIIIIKLFTSINSPITNRLKAQIIKGCL